MKKSPSDLQITILIVAFAIIVKKKYWWPPDQEHQIAWWTNYPIALAANKVALAASVAELARSVADSLMFLALYQNEPAFRNWVAQYMKYRKDIVNGKTQAAIGDPPVCPTLTFPTTVVMGMMQRTFAYIITLKKRTGYTDIIGTALLVIGDDYPGFNPDTYIANGKAKALPAFIQLLFVKGKFISSMETFRQRGTDPIFHSIGVFTKSKGRDNDPNLIPGESEIRNCKNKASIDNIAIGGFSPVYSVTC